MNHKETDVAALKTARGSCFLFPSQNRRAFPKSVNTQHAELKLLAVQFFGRKKNVVELNPVETRQRMRRRTHCSCWLVDIHIIDRIIDDPLASMPHKIAGFRHAPTTYLSRTTHHRSMYHNHFAEVHCYAATLVWCCDGYCCALCWCAGVIYRVSIHIPRCYTGQGIADAITDWKQPNNRF